MSNATMNRGQWGLLVLLSVLWGGSFFFVQVSVRELGPITLVACRVTLAAILLIGYVRMRGHSLPGDIAAWGAFLAMGLLNNAIPFTLIAWAQTNISSGLASILNASTPLFTVLLAHGLTRDERLTANRLAGAVIGFVGVALLMGPGAVAAGGGGWGRAAVLCAAISYACAGIFGRRFRGLSPAVAACGMLVCSSLVMVPTAWLSEGATWQWPGGAVVGATLGLAIASTAFAYLVYFRLLATAGASNLLLVTLLIPVAAISLGAGLLGETLSWHAVAGMVVIFLGLALVDGRILIALRRRPVRP